MSGTFLDTGYLIALINKKDNLHKVALEATEKFHGPFLTTQLILIELANSLCLPPQRPLAIKIIDRIQADPLTRVITLTPELMCFALKFS